VQVLNGEKPANSAPIRVDTKPGTISRYSGGGYVVAQQLLQDVTGESFPKLMHDTVLAPTGMTHSTYEQPLPKGRARGGCYALPPGWTTYSRRPTCVSGDGSGRTVDHAIDLARYAIEVQKTLAGTSDRVLSGAMARQMLTPGLNRQGLGPQVGGSAKRPFFTHGGANEGYRCKPGRLQRRRWRGHHDQQR